MADPPTDPPTDAPGVAPPIEALGTVDEGPAPIPAGLPNVGFVLPTLGF
jgi:hypothetical protein